MGRFVAALKDFENAIKQQGIFLITFQIEDYIGSLATPMHDVTTCGPYIVSSPLPNSLKTMLVPNSFGRSEARQ
jgi:hypothetical protein